MPNFHTAVNKVKKGTSTMDNLDRDSVLEEIRKREQLLDEANHSASVAISRADSEAAAIATTRAAQIRAEIHELKGNLKNQEVLANN